MIKTCSKCKTSKHISCFSADNGKKASKDGLRSRCKECRAEDNRSWHNRNKLRSLENSRKWKNKNPEKVKNQSKKWIENNKEAHKENNRIWKSLNKAANCNISSRYRARKTISSPPWLTAIQKAQITEMYDIAAARTFQTGIRYQVDHIHPLQGENFSGLHVPWNLQIITAKENASKRNRLI